MMTPTQYLLIKLAEECNEAGQRALKQSQFGSQQRQKGYRRNRDRLRDEVLDVLSHIQFLQAINELDEFTAAEIKSHADKKYKKMLRFMGMSRRKGFVR